MVCVMFHLGVSFALCHLSLVKNSNITEDYNHFDKLIFFQKKRKYNAVIFLKSIVITLGVTDTYCT